MLSGKKIGLLDLQEGLYQNLKDAGLNVRDAVSKKSPYPIVTLGNSQSLSEGSKTCNGDKIIERLHIWSRYKGFKECKEIINTILNKLTSVSLSTTTYQVRLIDAEVVQTLLDPDGLTRHAVLDLTFRVFQKA